MRLFLLASSAFPVWVGFLRLPAEMGIRELPRIGAMIETPAAALSIPSLKKHVDFYSIGSNDLTQSGINLTYTL
jgi:citrate lyase beta subunit